MHVPNLRKNLISIEKLAKDGYETTFLGDTWKISKGTIIVAHGKKSGTLYMTTNGRRSIALVESKEDPNLWYQRLGHMSIKRMEIMHSNGKPSSLKSTDLNMCESCILKKQRGVSFKKVKRLVNEAKLKLVHTNVWGPTSISSIGGKSYFMTFIDDHLRKVLVYFMRHKLEVFEIFNRWKEMVGNETSMKVKKLWFENGGKYEDSEFKKLCYENIIKLENTVPRTPQQNGITEQMNKTLTERARSMCIQTGLPK